MKSLAPAALVLLVASCAICRAVEVNDVPSGLTQTEVTGWEDELRQAGATVVELKSFEQRLRDMSSAECALTASMFQRAPSKFIREYLVDLRRGYELDALEPTPKPLYPGAAPVCTCDSLHYISIPNTTIDSVTIDSTQGWCRVVATVTNPPASDHIKIYVALPTKGWNGRFLGTGGGGFAGGSPTNLRAQAARGFAVAATDTGHAGLDGSFALDQNKRLDWQSIEDFAYLGIHEMTMVGKALVEAFYGRVPGRSYFIGGSTGGRQALMEAQRYPGDYNGIVAAAPAIYFNHLKFAQLWPQMVMLDADHFIPEAKLTAATAAAVESWRKTRHTSDEFIDDPRQFGFDAKSLVGTIVQDSVFTAADAEVIDQIWQGPRGRDGRFLWYGLQRGADLKFLAGTGGTPIHGEPYPMAIDWCQFFLAKNRAWKWTSINRSEFERLLAQSIEEFSPVIETADPNLTEYRDRGGKLIIWHGWADQFIPPEGSIVYYQQIARRMGGPQETSKFARLFMAPGVGHCGGGSGPQPFALIAAIIRWTEEGTPPDKLAGEMFDTNGVARCSRPLSSFVE